MTNPIALPPKMKKMTNFPPPPLFDLPSSPSFSSLPDEIVVSFLARISKSYYGSLCLVSKSFYSLLSSPVIYAARSEIGGTEPWLYVCLWLPTPNDHCWFTVMNPVEGELSLAPVRLSSSYAPARLNSTTVTVGFEIYQIGGTVKSKRSKAVRVLDCRSHTWRRAPNLTVARKCSKSCFLDGKIYVIGGEEEESMIWGEVFDIKTQTWKPLRRPSGDNVVVDDSNHKVVVLGARLYLITNHNNYAYDPREGIWLPDVGPTITGPCCVIDNVMFAEYSLNYSWYDSRYGKWLKVLNLGSLYAKRARNSQTVQLVNHGGKLVIIWQERIKNLDGGRLICTQDKRIWCAVISLEERLTFLGTQIWGEVERCNVVVLTVPKSSKLLSCLSVSV